MSDNVIRESCFQPAASYNWTAPTGVEILKLIQIISWPVDEIGRYLGCPKSVVTDWLTDKTEIPFSAWAILAYQAGRGEIWKI